jgi:hypothetical protein
VSKGVPDVSAQKERAKARVDTTENIMRKKTRKYLAKETLGEVELGTHNEGNCSILLLGGIQPQNRS